MASNWATTSPDSVTRVDSDRTAASTTSSSSKRTARRVPGPLLCPAALRLIALEATAIWATAGATIEILEKRRGSLRKGPPMVVH